MNSSPVRINFMPGEYRKAADRLFSKGRKIDTKAVMEFAKALGIGMEYQRLFALDKKSEELGKFMERFQYNLDLLIQKTWVDKSEEKRKGKLRDEIPSLMATLENWDLFAAIEEFAAILNELAYLFFGAQSEKEDFTEYTFRIDAQMGLFWWYSGRMVLFKELYDNSGHDDKVLWAVLLLGLCYLTNF